MTQASKFGSYYIGSKLGEGSCSEVFKTRKDNCEEVALKIIKRYDEQNLASLHSTIQEKLNHEHIVRIQELIKDCPSLSYTGCIGVAMDYCTMENLEVYLINNSPSVLVRLELMIDITRGLNYLHGKNVIHSNLKPSNILLQQGQSRFICKLSDYGMDRLKVQKDSRTDDFEMSEYDAPEFLTQQSCSKFADVFSLGLVFFVLYKCNIIETSTKEKVLIPGYKDSKNNICYLNSGINKNKYTECSFMSSFFQESTEIGTLVFGMLKLNPAERLPLDHVLVNLVEHKVQWKSRNNEDKMRSALARQSVDIMNYKAAIIRLQKEKEVLPNYVHKVENKQTWKQNVQNEVWKILVKRSSGRIVELEASENDTIVMVKDKLQEIEGIPVNLQRLRFAGKQLNDEQTLKFYNVKKESVLDLVIVWSTTFLIYVKTLSGKIINIGVAEDDTVETLKGKLEYKEGIPVPQQKLVFAGNELEVGHKLTDYYIQKECTVMLVQKEARPTAKKQRFRKKRR